MFYILSECFFTVWSSFIYLYFLLYDVWASWILRFINIKYDNYYFQNELTQAMSVVVDGNGPL